MSIDSLDSLVEEQLRDLYDAEKQLTKALPKMAKAASSADLKAAFEDHLEVTKGQIQRLEQVFKLLELPAKGKHCKAMEGLIEEGKEILESDGEPEMLDAAMVAAAQRIEHYEIAGYGSVRTFASILGRDDVAKLLQETLDEEKEADEKLTEVCVEMLEGAAMSGEDDEDEEDVDGVAEEMDPETEEVEEEPVTTTTGGKRRGAAK